VKFDDVTVKADEGEAFKLGAAANVVGLPK